MCSTICVMLQKPSWFLVKSQWKETEMLALYSGWLCYFDKMVILEASEQAKFSIAIRSYWIL